MQNKSQDQMQEVQAAQPGTQHSVWFAMELMVNALTPQEAYENGRSWLAGVLASESLPFRDGVRVACGAQRLTDIASLAFQLLSLEERGGEDAAWVWSLRSQMSKRIRERKPQ